ncbi:MAG: four helix bundle protein [Phycisphaerales bacterium]|nr:four helix bundle protein [Phycisphaerales bacterium]
MDKERVGSFEQMKVWQEAHALALKIFQATPQLPAEQQEGLALQMERAAVEVPKNIAEGFKRRGPRNKAHYYNLAQSALEGLRYYFILCRDLNFTINFEDLSYRGDQVARMLDGLVRSMGRNNRDQGGRGGRGGQGGRGGRHREDGPEPREADFDESDGGDDDVDD